MAETNFIKRSLDAGMAFTANTQARAEELVKELVQAGEVQAEQAQALVADLIDRSRRNTEELVTQIRQELANSAETLGLATLADLSRVEELIERLTAAVEDLTARAGDIAEKASERVGSVTGGSKKPTGEKSSTAKKATTAKRATAKKPSTAKKTASKKASTAKKATTTKKASTAKKATTAKKTTATKAAAPEAAPTTE